LQLLVISALAGIGEEALFRGVVQAAIGQWSGLPWLGLLVASVLFGLAHMITATYAVVAALIGAYLGWLLLLTMRFASIASWSTAITAVFFR